MKRMIVILVVAMSLLAVAGANAQDYPPGTITVDGFGQVYGAPDVAHVQLGVQSSSEDVLTAYNDANTTIQKVITALTDMGIAPADIQTTGLSLYQDNSYNPNTNTPDQKPTYRAQNSLNVTVRDVSTVGEVVNGGVGAGANSINGVSFDMSDPSALEQQAREAAVNDARARAEQLASLLNVTLGEASTVVETVGNTPPIIMNRSLAAAQAAPSPVQEGQLAVSVQVTVTFTIGA